MQDYIFLLRMIYFNLLKSSIRAGARQEVRYNLRFEAAGDEQKKSSDEAYGKYCNGNYLDRRKVMFARKAVIVLSFFTAPKGSQCGRAIRRLSAYS